MKKSSKYNFQNDFFSGPNSLISYITDRICPYQHSYIYAIANTGYCCSGVAFSAFKVHFMFSFFCLVPCSWLETRETSCSGGFRSSYATAAVRHLFRWVKG